MTIIVIVFTLSQLLIAYLLIVPVPKREILLQVIISHWKPKRGLPWAHSMLSRDVNAATRLAEACLKRDNEC